MKKIKEIKIQNFKAFQQEQVFPINGKHVLVYGNLFWALYTLLQSSIKDDDGLILNKEEKEDLKFFDGFQKFILTHDKGFFNLIRRNTDEEKWAYFNFNKDENDSSAPRIKEDKTPLQKAIKNFEEDEFDACGMN